MTHESAFRIAFSADFLDENRQLIFPDIGLSVLDTDTAVAYEFMPEYKTEYVPEQLMPYDVVITLKPRVSTASLNGIDKLCAIGRCGVGYDNVDLRPAPNTMSPSSSHPPELYGLWPNPSCSSRLRFPTTWCRRTAWCERADGPRGRPAFRPGTPRPRRRDGGTGKYCQRDRAPSATVRCSEVSLFRPFVSKDYADALGVTLTTLGELMHESDYVLINCPLDGRHTGTIWSARSWLRSPTAFLINTARVRLSMKGP